MARLDRIATRIFYDDKRRIIFFPLFVVSLVYRAVVGIRNFLYKCGLLSTQSVTCPVISVGNIMVGGTGKTPTVIMLADMLKGHGWRPAVLSRGYGGKRKNKNDAAVVSDGKAFFMGPREAGDEPVQIAESLPSVPVIVGADRALAGRLAIEKLGANVLILDDGFQHRQLTRDIDIVLLDEERPFGNGFLLPRGGLREPHRALKRADTVILTTGGSHDGPLGTGFHCSHVFRGCRTPVNLIRGFDNNKYPLADLSGKSVCAFSGIARPEGFQSMLKPLCSDLTSLIPFPDHHIYTVGDIEHIRKKYRDCGAHMLVTTVKDGVKLKEWPDFFRELWMLDISMEIFSPDLDFEEYIIKRLER